MERKFLLQEEAKVKYTERRRKSMEGRPSCSFSCSSSTANDSKCCNKAVEFACSACLFCVSCPLSIVWCCIRMPLKIGWQAARRAGHQLCCGSEKKIFAAYSSFSDIDSDGLPSPKPYDTPRNKVTQRISGLHCKRSETSGNLK